MLLIFLFDYRKCNYGKCNHFGKCNFISKVTCDKSNYCKCNLWKKYYGKRNYGKNNYDKNIMANETEPTTGNTYIPGLDITVLFIKYFTLRRYWFPKTYIMCSIYLLKTYNIYFRIWIWIMFRLILTFQIKFVGLKLNQVKFI